jgi:hypothetical protein
VDSVGTIRNRVTLEDVRAARPAMIFYGANTCWWTHDPNHLGRLPDSGLPCDPRGGVLFQTDDVEGFLRAAEEAPDHYGRHGLQAFVAAHHENCTMGDDDPTPWAFPTWDEYNDAIDRGRDRG